MKNKTMKNKTMKIIKLDNKSNYSKSKKNQTFTKNDYLSGDGMLTSVWGPGMWHYLHTMSFNYPVEPTIKDKNHYRDFMLSLQHVLPCKYCRINLKTNYKQMPLTMNDMKNMNRGAFGLILLLAIFILPQISAASFNPQDIQ